MSDFVQQNSSECAFSTSDSWVVLSPIEQSIKQKIEKVGVPLKDWDINIYRGVLTGFNDAFIISEDKKNEILSNCLDEDEKRRTAEIIRPVLRGRDIKRYSYEYANLYLIATFPSRHYDIEQYPAIKKYLLSFGMERLEQTGKEYIINGEKIKARKKTNNKWFEIQDSINYWDDFFKPKIMYSEIVQSPQFYLDEKKHFIPEATTFILTGVHLKYLCNLFNSKPVAWFFKRFYAGGGLGENGYRYKKVFFEKLPIPKFVNSELQNEIEKTIDLNRKVYELYGLSQKEIDFIENL